ncbi:lasso RiPP family leader peptide-containing protein [Jiulongibacter sp. NS-SX5]|uniref:lasso RiPP family leader peptide-containing protein n=1 Tax=Jiulongibacter sp. NS-SX5 TaxID=3463854 RepID=UPI00405A441A
MNNSNQSFFPREKGKKKAYSKPKLRKLGSVKELTLKTGSVSDFGSNQFQP